MTLVVWTAIAVLFVMLAIPFAAAMRGGSAGPRRDATLGAVATIVSLGMAGWVQHGIHRLESWSRVEHHDLASVVEGEQVLRVRSLPGIPGVQLRLVPKGTASELPFPWERFREASWRVVYRGHDEYAASGSGSERASCGVPISWIDPGCLLDMVDRDASPEGEPIEIRYTVTPRTAPVISSVQLDVRMPFGLGEEAALAGVVLPVMRAVALGMAAFGCLALLALGVRASWSER